MRFFQISSCCGLFSLEAGGIIIGISALATSFSNFYVSSFWLLGISLGVISVLMWSAWLYGIYSKRPDWMISAVIFNKIAFFVAILFVIQLMILGVKFSSQPEWDEVVDTHVRKEARIIALIVMPFLGAYFSQLAQEDYDDISHEPMFRTTFFFKVLLFVTVFTVIEWHIVAVMNSLYESMKHDTIRSNQNEESAPYRQPFVMKFFKVSSFCYYFNLETGGLFIATQHLIGWMLFVFSQFSNGWTVSLGVYATLTWLAWMLGIYSKRTSWMMPALILYVFGFFVSSLFIIGIPIFCYVLGSEIQRDIDAQAQMEATNPVDIRGTLIETWNLAAIGTIVYWYIVAVMYSLFESMERNSRSIGQEESTPQRST